MTDPEKPTPESIAAAKPQDGPPPQLGEDWIESATPEQTAVAFKAMQLHAYLGGQVDADGWPVGPNGKRLNIGSSS